MCAVSFILCFNFFGRFEGVLDFLEKRGRDAHQLGGGGELRTKQQDGIRPGKGTAAWKGQGAPSWERTTEQRGQQRALSCLQSGVSSCKLKGTQVSQQTGGVTSETSLFACLPVAHVTAVKLTTPSAFSPLTGQRASL